MIKLGLCRPFGFLHTWHLDIRFILLRIHSINHFPKKADKRNFWQKQKQESHAVAGKSRDAAVNSDRYQQPVGQKQSEWETENIT